MVTLRTTLCDLLRIEVPIIQAPISGAATPALVAAVSNAGGLGMFAMANRDPDGIRRIIHETQQLTDRPFGANFLLRPQEETHARLDACLDAGVPAVSFFWGDPAPYIARVHAAGALVIYTVASGLDARRAVDAGVDIVVAQGWEAGGHVRGQVAALPLVPRVVDAVTPTPVVAAGGIADGRGMAAALTLGAAGVCERRLIAARRTVNQEVAGSSPARGANYRRHLRPRPSRACLARLRGGCVRSCPTCPRRPCSSPGLGDHTCPR
jgi:nitronate monooxygenase